MFSCKLGKIVVYAPNIHTGGGYMLLRALLSELPKEKLVYIFLDSRSRVNLPSLSGVVVKWVNPNIVSRLKAELQVYMHTCLGDRVLCFHGLPLLLPNKARLMVFLQNRLYIESTLLAGFKWRTRMRLTFERFVARVFRHRVSEYIVQTPAMQRTLLKWLNISNINDTPEIKVLPFIDCQTSMPVHADSTPVWDFVYVADGEAHKNHHVLLEAWSLLAREGLWPSLALTLSSRDKVRKSEVEVTSRQYGLRIDDLGQMTHKEVLALYGRSGALIFPSTSESFGLPLIEATQAGLPILAPELDYVRDVCVPVQTFDPQSPVSIARAVKRFLGKPEPTVKLQTPADFWRAVLSDDQQ